MDTQQQRRHECRKINEINKAAEGKELEQVQQQRAATAAPNSPQVLSASSSPSHEFSFTISLHSSETTKTTTTTKSSSSVTPETKQQQLAIDLSPADEIFFHGHLLPLHFLSHLNASSSPRPTSHSADNFSGSITREVSLQEKPFTNSTTDNRTSTCSCTADDHFISFNKDYGEIIKTNDNISNIHNCSRKQSSSSSNTHNRFKSFSLFGLSKWKKPSEKTRDQSAENSNRNRLKFDVTQFLKRYINMVKPLLSARGGRRENVRIRRQSYSFSGMVSPRDSSRELMRGRRGEFSAPASMKTSPTNSGRIIATQGMCSSPVSDSTMEELQAAIQAAIAHCKKSISNEEKNSQEISSSSISVN